MTEKNWPVTTEIPVLWGDMDAFGHVNNIIYLKWCETSRIELFCKIWDLDALKMDEILDTVTSEAGKSFSISQPYHSIEILAPFSVFLALRILSLCWKGPIS